MSIASVQRFGKSELQTKDQCMWLCNPGFLLKCIRFDWHSDGTKQNWVDLEQNEI